MTMKTDVLVVGSGGAGLVAACAAKTAGMEVMLLTKSHAGVANSTAYAGGGFTMPFGALSAEEHNNITFETGRFLNTPHMLDALSNESVEAVKALRDFGVQVDLRDGGASVAKYAKSEMMGGTGMTLPLVEFAKTNGVNIVERAMVTGVYVEDGRAVGVRVLNCKDGSLYSIAAKSVVIATGGGGRIYSRTDNPARTTGDGLAIGYELGLPLVDMEFVQFYPMGFAEPGLPVWMIGLDWLDYARLTNSDGEEFLRRRWPEWGVKNGLEANLYTRDKSAIAIENEWRAGRQVWFHFAEVPGYRWQMPHGRMIRKLFTAQRPLEAGPVRVRPLQHYFPGGIVIEPDCSTRIDGLFVCGEATGGTDGANRIGGNALSMITVFGFKAAKAAVNHALGRDLRSLPKSHPNDVLHHEWSTRPGGLAPKEVKRLINSVSDVELGVIRSGCGLRRALSEFAAIEQRLDAISVGTPAEMMEAYEARNMLLVAKMVAAAANARTESRGVHFREDYPTENKDWLKRLLVRQKNGNICVEQKLVECF